MALELTPEQAERLQNHLRFSNNCSRAQLSYKYNKIPTEIKQTIMQRYKAGQSIRFICQNYKISRHTFYKIRKEAEGAV